MLQIGLSADVTSKSIRIYLNKVFIIEGTGTGQDGDCSIFPSSSATPFWYLFTVTVEELYVIYVDRMT